MRLKSILFGCKATLALVIVVSFVAPIALGQQPICTVSGSIFQLSEPYTVTKIVISHKSDVQSGSVWLNDPIGNQYGPWNAKVEPDKWVVYPDAYLTKGSYRLVDSDPGTYQGQAWIYGFSPETRPTETGTFQST